MLIDINPSISFGPVIMKLLKEAFFPAADFALLTKAFLVPVKKLCLFAFAFQVVQNKRFRWKQVVYNETRKK